MAIKIQCYTESDNATFFGDDSDLQHQLPAPTYDEPKARTGKPPVVIDNRAVRAWLIETGCLSYTQLVEAYPWADDVFTGLSRATSGAVGAGYLRRTCSLPYMAPTTSSPVTQPNPTLTSLGVHRLLATCATSIACFRLRL